MKRSTKETNKAKALKIAVEFETTARKARTSKQVRTVIQDLHQEITGEEMGVTSVSQFLTQWTEDKRTSTGSSTFSRYNAVKDAFLKFLGPKANDEIINVNRQDIRKFHNAEALRVSASTANGELKCLRMAFNAARRDGLIVENPCEFVQAAKKSEEVSERRPFLLTEIQEALKFANEEWQTMILIGLYTGQRLADIALLTWSNVDLVNEKIRLTTRKTGKKLSIPIAQPLLKHLKALDVPSSPASPIHPAAHSCVQRQKGKVGTLSNQFATILALAGLRPKLSRRSQGKGRTGKRDFNPLSFHCIRHTAVTMLKEAGVPAAVVMELIGHDSEAMSEHYTHVGDEALIDAAAKMPNVLK